MIYAVSITLLVAYVTLASTQTVKPPTVHLDQGTFIGVANLSTHKFLGIPFAKPPLVNIYFSPDIAASDRPVIHY